MGHETSQRNISDQDHQNIAKVWRRCRAAVPSCKRSAPCNYGREKHRRGRKLALSAQFGCAQFAFHTPWRLETCQARWPRRARSAFSGGRGGRGGGGGGGGQENGE